ncbi:phage tail tip lysozyme [Chelatococcus sp.]|uniref:phage tail tip lysozyme n=1 Tax=Chelatococcus sp. TaxID=1953771 RepID=UPI001EB9FB99|nr:phage tail tip lysozyme [Chelatococcus sp.]MBX3543745.1 hypothetical protein [Chelatococcus sp.]CAH1677777.1 hypothetical protein CHELA41_24442 [Hyphomicrobiales bacterium]
MATTQTTYPSQWTAEGLFNLWNSAGALANSPYSPYTGELHAGLTPTQQNAINGLNNLPGTTSPYFNLAGDWMKGAMATSGFTGQPFAQGATYLSNAAGYGDAATGYNNQAGAYGQQAANYVGQGANYANTAAGIGQQALGYGKQASGLVNQGAAYGSQAANYVGQGANYASQAANIANGALGYGQQAAGMIGQGSQYGAQAADYANQLGQTKITPMAFSSQALQQYLDPGQQALVDATMNTLSRQNAQQQNKLAGNLASKGAWGGDRAGVAQAELAAQQGLLNAQTLAQLNSANYSQALGMFNQQQGVDLQGQLANANNLGQASGLLSNIGGLYGQFGNSLLGAGNLQNSVANTYAGLGNLSNQFAGSMLGAGNLYNSLAGTTNQTGALANNVAGMYSGLGSLSNQLGGTMLGAGNLSLGQGNLALGQGQLNMGLGNASTNLGNAISGVSKDQAAIASMYAGLGPAAQNAQLQSYLAQLQGGTLQQQDTQAWQDKMYNQWNLAQQAPYDRLGWLAGIQTGLNPQLGSTTIGTGQQPSGLSQIAGGLASGIGALGATGAFGTGTAAAGAAGGAAGAGWLTTLLGSMFADGGKVGDTPSAEPMRDLVAQAGDLGSPEQPRSGVWLSAANIAEWGPEALQQVLSAGTPIPNFDGNGGVLVAKDPQTAEQAVAARNSGVPMQAILGALTGAGTGKPDDPVAAVQQTLPDGAVTRERLVGPTEAPGAASEFSSPGRDVRVLPLLEALARRGNFASGGSVNPESFGMTEAALRLAAMLQQKYGGSSPVDGMEAPPAPMAPPDVGGSALRDALRFANNLGDTGLGMSAGGSVGANDNSVARALREIAPTVKAIKGSAKPAGAPAPRRPQAGLGGMRMAKAQRPRYAVGGVVGSDQDSRRRQAMEFLLRQGYSPAQAAGMVGNLMAESTAALNPMAVGDNGTAFGAAQWRGDRRSGLTEFAKGRGLDPNDFGTQMKFANAELQTTEAPAGAKLRAASTPQEAATAATDFFRPAGWTRSDPSNSMHLNERVQNALNVAKEYSGLPQPSDLPAEGSSEAQAPAQPVATGDGMSNFDRWLPLIQAGLATMGGQSKNPWQNIAAGASAGVQMLNQQRGQARKDARDAQKEARDERQLAMQEQHYKGQADRADAAALLDARRLDLQEKNYDAQGRKIDAEIEALKNKTPTAPAGYRWGPDGRALEAIPGGPQDPKVKGANEPLPGEIATRFGLANEFFKRFPTLDTKIGEGALTGIIDATRAQAGAGEPGQLFRDLELGAEAMTRMLTGAGQTEFEARQAARRYLPEITDKATTLQDKARRLRDSLRSMQREALRGRMPQEEIDRQYPVFIDAPADEPNGTGFSRKVLEDEARRRGLLK